MTDAVTDGVLAGYDAGGYYCEMLGRAGAPAEHTAAIRRHLAGLGIEELRARTRDAERELFNLGEAPILANVETDICREEAGLKYTLDHLEELVVKPVDEAGGTGITVCPRAAKAEIEACRAKLLAAPKTYISQPTIDLSVCPTLVGAGGNGNEGGNGGENGHGAVEPRHVDLRPFAVTGRDTWVLPGGLTRVALPKGSLIVNSSQGGGSKDTWVLE
ncbi:MAG: circularly permuted type 2 ATP-grasp protein [Proteobacteria bacterium]|nr:circularly permuted type 2 ATP-grasp protein [Pseudomonadota bacterium]